MPAPATRDYFAELYVAGLFGDAGWAVYFPKRDVGFDFIVTKEVDGQQQLRPVQVKALYPTGAKKDRPAYGFRGELTVTHPQMVLVLPFFSLEKPHAPDEVAFMPLDRVKQPSSGGFRCLPASFEAGRTTPRRDSAQYFGQAGVKRLEHPDWGRGA